MICGHGHAPNTISTNIARRNLAVKKCREATISTRKSVCRQSDVNSSRAPVWEGVLSEGSKSPKINEKIWKKARKDIYESERKSKGTQIRRGKHTKSLPPSLSLSAIVVLCVVLLLMGEDVPI